MKFAPVFPERFAPLGDARESMAKFVEDYNHQHRHTGIGLNTPAEAHYGLAAVNPGQRATTLAAARAQRLEGFSTSQDPKILALPDTVWINKPDDAVEGALAENLAA